MKRRHPPKVAKGEPSAIRRKKIRKLSKAPQGWKSIYRTGSEELGMRPVDQPPSRQERFIAKMMENKKKDDELREALERGLDQFSFWGMRKPK